MSDFLNPFAELDAPDSGKYIDPDRASLEHEGSDFYCPVQDCPDPERRLMLVKSKSNFFRHYGDYSHEILPETLLHKCAISWFVNRNSFEIPEHRYRNDLLTKQIILLNPEATKCEYRYLRSTIPDVRLKSIDGFEFAVEIVVTNDISDEKKKLLLGYNFPVLRIDLSSFYYANRVPCQTDLKFVKANLNSLLTDLSRKSWVLHQTDNAVREENKSIETNKESSGWGWVLSLLLFLAGWFFYRYRGRRKKL